MRGGFPLGEPRRALPIFNMATHSLSRQGATDRPGAGVGLFWPSRRNRISVSSAVAGLAGRPPGVRGCRFSAKAELEGSSSRCVVPGARLARGGMIPHGWNSVGERALSGPRPLRGSAGFVVCSRERDTRMNRGLTPDEQVERLTSQLRQFHAQYPGASGRLRTSWTVFTSCEPEVWRKHGWEGRDHRILGVLLSDTKEELRAALLTLLEDQGIREVEFVRGVDVIEIVRCS
jgi:hypothetical protein